MPAGADNVAAGNVPSASPKAPAACQDPVALACARGREGVVAADQALFLLFWSPMSKRPPDPERTQRPSGDGCHHTPPPEKLSESKPELQGARPDAAATPGMRKGRGQGEIKGALAWSNLSQHQAPSPALPARPWPQPRPRPGPQTRPTGELSWGNPGGRAAAPGAGWPLGGPGSASCRGGGPRPSIPGSGPWGGG